MKNHKETGIAAVEFALVLPVLLTLVFGAIEFSIALYDKSVITNASREGARAGIVLKNPKASVSDIQNVVLNYCQANLITFGSATTPTVTVPSGSGGISVRLSRFRSPTSTRGWHSATSSLR